MKSENLYKTVLIVVVVVAVYGYISGYRLTSYTAAQRYLSSFEIDRTSEILVEQIYDWGRIYLFDSGESKRTVVTEKRGPFWISRDGFYSYVNDDTVKTIGWASSNKGTFLVVEVLDPTVSYIEAGEGEDRLQHYIDKGELVVFSWDTPQRWNDIEGKAYSAMGQLLYEYRYSSDNVINMSSLAWHPLEEQNIETGGESQQAAHDNIYKNWHNTWTDISETDGELTDDQISRINKLLAPVDMTGQWAHVNPISCFVTSYYNKPSELDLDAFLRYFPYKDVTDQLPELEALRNHRNWPFGEDSTLESIPVPIHRYKGEVVRKYLATYMDLDDVEDLVLEEAIYLESTDAFYNYTSDFGPGIFECIEGIVEDGIVTLNGASSVLTIMKMDDKYVIKSHSVNK